MTHVIPLASTGRRGRGFMDNTSALPTTPQPLHHQPRRTFDASEKTDIFTRHRQLKVGANGERRVIRGRSARFIRMR
jgi:hypothetical protein